MAELFSSLRAPETLGLAGMMRPEARIYHEMLFDLNGIGRVSDLFSARLRKVIPDEVAFRASLLFGVVDAFPVFVPGSPIRIECGLDSEKIGMTISFSLDPSQSPSMDGIKDRIKARRPANSIERVLDEILDFGERVYFKSQPSTGKAEICILVSINSGQVGVGQRNRGHFDAMLLPGETENLPPVAEYTLLADLDYRKLLRSSRSGSDPEAPYAGEVLLHEARDSAGVMEAIRMRKLLRPEASIASEESYREADQAIRIKEVTQKIESDQSKVRIEASPHEEVPSEAIVDEFPAALSELEDDEAAPAQTAKPVQKAKKRPRKGILGRLFSVLAGDKEEPEVEGEADPALVAHAPDEVPELNETPEPDSHADREDPIVGAGPAPSLRELQRAAHELESELSVGGFSGIVERFEKEGALIKAEVKNTKAEKWIEGLATELVSERAKIAELAKKLNLAMRQKEHEFKNRENALVQSVRTKEESLRSKTLQLMRMKDQVAKLQMTVERAKSGSGGAEESASKIKLTQVQRMLQNSRSENEQLNHKLQEMKARFDQMVERGKQAVPATLYNERQKKAEKLARQVEELKRAGAGQAAQPKAAVPKTSSDDDSEAA